MAAKKIAKNIKFEDALNELEAQVQLLESGELPLDKALDYGRRQTYPSDSADGCGRGCG